MELEEVSPLLFQHFNTLLVVSPVFRCVYVRAAYNGPFRKHYFNCSEDSLRMAPNECRDM